MLRTAFKNAWSQPSLESRLSTLAGLVIPFGAVALFVYLTVSSVIHRQYAPSVIGFLASAVFVLIGIKVVRTLAAGNRLTLEGRLGEVRGSLENIGRVLGDLDQELATRLAALEATQARLERYEQAGIVTPEQRQAVDQIFDERLQKESRRSRRRDLVLFTLGIPVGFALNVASAPLWHLLTK
jgi:hypothetical protein